jgi:hypothetical protein
MKKSKTKYSKFNSGFIKKWVNIINYNYNQISNTGNRSDKILFNSIKSFIEFGYENIFIETEELYNFFKDTHILTHGDISAQIYTAIEDRKYTQLQEVDVHNGKRKLRVYNFMVYAPINVINTALSVTLFVTDKEIEYLEINDEIFSKDNIVQKTQNRLKHFLNSLCWTGKIDFGSTDILLNEKSFLIKNINGWLKKDIDNFHVILNMLFYMNAFPDYVYEGVPKRAVLDEDVNIKKRITLMPNEKFLRKITISPHLRSGHFRTYKSDYFTNMKGKTEWIEPIFVKGIAITVEDGISI